MKQSAGILLYKVEQGELKVLLVHPGGPFWKNKDSGSWSIPKGEYDDSENPLQAAIREFEEETGMSPAGNFKALSDVRLKSGKIVSAWAVGGNFDTSKLKSNSFELEWPPRSGISRSFPEVDQAGWLPVTEALEKINIAQQAFILELVEILKT